MDWEWKCDSEYVRIRKQMHHCEHRNQASVVAAYIMGWCKIEDTVSLILIESACAIKKLKYWKRNLKPNYSALQSYWEFLHRARMDRKKQWSLTSADVTDIYLNSDSAQFGTSLCQDQNRKTEVWIWIVKAVVIKPVKHKLC